MIMMICKPCGEGQRGGAWENERMEKGNVLQKCQAMHRRHAKGASGNPARLQAVQKAVIRCKGLEFKMARKEIQVCCEKESMDHVRGRKEENIMSGKKWPWIAVDVSEVLDENGVFLVLRQCENGVPEIAVCYEDEADAQAEADERNAKEEQ